MESVLLPRTSRVTSVARSEQNPVQYICNSCASGVHLTIHTTSKHTMRKEMLSVLFLEVNGPQMSDAICFKSSGYRSPSEGDNALGSFGLSVCPFVYALMVELLDLKCLCVSNQWAYADNRF